MQRISKLGEGWFPVLSSLRGLRCFSELTLNNLPVAPGSHKRKLRVGRGIGTGLGKTAGRGAKGQHKRNTVRPGFEGGQTPLFRRLPKRGFTNIHALDLQPVNLDRLQYFIDTGRLNPNEPITLKSLKDSGMIKRMGDGVKLLGNGKEYFNLPLKLEVTRASQAAIEAVERAGGAITCSYYNKLNLRHLLKPEKYPLTYKRAGPPTPKLIAFYKDAKNRGYLASTEEIAKMREEAHAAAKAEQEVPLTGSVA